MQHGYPTYKQNQINEKLHDITFSIHSILTTAPGLLSHAVYSVKRPLWYNNPGRFFHGQWKNVVEIKIALGLNTGRNCYENQKCTT